VRTQLKDLITNYELSSREMPYARNSGHASLHLTPRLNTIYEESSSRYINHLVGWMLQDVAQHYSSEYLRRGDTNMSTIHVPVGFSWVTASLLSVATLLQWQGLSVCGARKKAHISYPLAYADKAEQEASKEAMIFNCMQRAHQNTLENAPVVVLTTVISGLRYPIPAAAGCGLWVLSRFVYTVRYGAGDPKKRMLPVRIGFLVQIALSALSGKVVYDLIKAGI